MKRTASILVVLMLLLPVAFVMGGGAKETSGTSEQQAAAPGQVKTGGTLTMAIEAEPPMLDPALEQSNLVTSICDLVYDYLWRWDKDFGKFDAHVADSWKWVDDTHFQLHVRTGVKFHNGRTVTADDVKYSIERILDPKTGSPSAVFLEPIQSVSVNDSSTVTINLKHAWFGLQDVLARQVAIVPKEVVQQYGDLKTHPVGSGPFVFDSWQPGLQMKFTKFKDYWMQGRPYLDAVVLKFMPEYNTAKNALLSHQVDIINWPDNADLNTLAATKGLELHPYSQNAVMYIAMNTKHPPLDNVLVRRAVALATSRDAYNAALYGGRAKVAFSPIPTTQPYYKKSWEYAKDIDKAKQLLAQAGFANGFTIHILALKSPEEIMGEVLQADLAAIGVKGVIDVAEVPVALDAIFNKQSFDFALLGDVTSPDPDLFLAKYMVSDGQAAGATGRWDNPQVRDLVVKGRGTLDMTARVQIYQQIYDIVGDQVPMVFLAYPVRAPVSWNYVNGWFAWGDIRYDWPNVWLNK